MEGKYYLSDIMNAKDGQNGITALYTSELNLIIGSTGCGKTMYITDYLIPMFQHKSRILYLIDTTAGNIQLVRKNSKTFCFLDDYFKQWQDAINANTIIQGGWGSWNGLGNRVVVMTYHMFLTLLNSKDSIIPNFDLIVADEIHNLYYYQKIKNDYRNNYLKSVENWLKMVITMNNKVKVVALTATPLMVWDMFPNRIINTVLTDNEIKELKRYETHRLDYYITMDNIIYNLPNGRGIIYTDKIENQERIIALINKLYPNKYAINIYSKNSKKHMNDEQLAVWDYIINNEVIPDYIDILLINKSCETSINIRDIINNDESTINMYKIDYMIIDKTAYDDTIQQVRGRYRADLDYGVQISDNPTKIYIPDKYLNRELDRPEREYLAHNIINYKTGTFTSAKKLLIDCGLYNVSMSKASNNFYKITQIQ